MIAACSDTHKGNGGRREQLGPEDVTRWCQSCLSLSEDPELDLVALLGDIFEMWDHRPDSVLLDYDTRRMIRALEPVSRQCPIIYCVGNHDEAVLADPRIRGMIPDWIWVCKEYDHNGTLLMHGHQLDRWNSDHRWVGRTISRTAAAVGTVSSRAYSWLRSTASRVEGAGRYSRNDRHADQAVAYMRERGCSRIVTGHTHRRVEEGIYRDCGTWVDDGWLVI